MTQNWNLRFHYIAYLNQLYHRQCSVCAVDVGEAHIASTVAMVGVFTVLLVIAAVISKMYVSIIEKFKPKNNGKCYSVIKLSIVFYII